MTMRFPFLSFCFTVLLFLLGCAGTPLNDAGQVSPAPTQIVATQTLNPVLVNAVDVSVWTGPISSSEMQCLYQQGIRHLIAGTQQASTTRQQLQTALNAGMTVDAYVYLYWSGDMTAQVQAALNAVAGIPIGRLWLDCEDAPGGLSASQIVARIQQARSACGNTPCGIYTRKSWWLSSTNDSNSFSDLPIWYALYDGNGDFDEWWDPDLWYEGPFGGWVTPTGKQYTNTSYPCGVGVDFDVMTVDPSPPSGAYGEVGRVTVSQSDANQWHPVSFQGRYQRPVVIMDPPSYGGAGPVTIRIRNVTGSGFEFQLDEWDYQNGSHMTETVSYLVLESGTTRLGSKVIEVGTLTVNQQWQSPSFTKVYGKAPVVFAQVQTANDPAAVVTRLRNVKRSGFSVRLQEEEGSDGVHGSETVGYVAILPGTGTDGDNTFEAVLTPNAVTSAWYSVDFTRTYGDPVFIASMQSAFGLDPANLRYRRLTSTGVQLLVQEEQSFDSEQNHMAETVGYLVFDHPGLLGAD